MNIPCLEPCIRCAPSVIGKGVGPIDPDYPFVNLSSETPDEDIFIGINWQPPGGGQPPLGSPWLAVGCVGFCVSTVSQEEANLCAAQQQVLCTGTNWPVPGNPPQLIPCNPAIQDCFPVDPRTVFFNNAQFCPFTCPDGTVSYFTVASGRFSDFNQATADLKAYSYACQQAALQFMCLGSLTTARGCRGVVFSSAIIGSTPNPPVTYTVIGSLPPGLFAASSPSTLLISGIPTSFGDFPFSVQATNSIGQSVTKDYSINLFAIVTPSPLSYATVGQPYSTTPITGGAVGPVVWSVSSGSLPLGLSLNTATGEISGTPEFDGQQGFTLTATDNSLSCSKAFLMTVNEPVVDCQGPADAWKATLIVTAGPQDLTIHPVAAYTGPPFTLFVENLSAPQFNQCVPIATGFNSDIVIDDWLTDPYALTAYCNLCEDDIFPPAWDTFALQSACGSIAGCHATLSLVGGGGTWSILNGSTLHAPNGGNVGMFGALNIINTNSGECPCDNPGVLRFTFDYAYHVAEVSAPYGAFLIYIDEIEPPLDVPKLNITSTGPQSGSGTFVYDKPLVAGDNLISFRIMVTGYGGAPSVGSSSSGTMTIEHIV